MRYGQRCFYVKDDEFPIYVHPKYNFLKMHKNVGKYEKICGFINDLADMLDNNCILMDIETSHGGFIPLHCAQKCKKVILHNTLPEHLEYIKKNIKCMELRNVFFEDCSNDDILITHSMSDVDSLTDNNILIIKSKNNKYQHIIKLDDYYIHIPDKYMNTFHENFRYYLNGDNFEYNNLINMVVMVKNGGDLFKKMLEHNLQFIDRWTILDTGSTDGTQDAVRTIMKDKKGILIEEEFINFRESRNRSIRLAGQFCKFNVILDDTYMLRGDLRKFLLEVRDDVMTDSFSLMIRSDDVEYGSNRITKSMNNIKYESKIHEILQEYKNINVLVPITDAHIVDETDEYMRVRTYQRKQMDIELLNEMVEEEPDNPRHLYYLAQTYSLLQQYDKAADYFMQRVNHFKEGFIQEKVDACFELARLCNFKLNIPWEKCEELYLKAHELDNTRPDSLYFIGLHYYAENNLTSAYNYLKRAFEIGYPAHTQYSLKPTISFYFVPKFLANVCYHNKDYILGKKACDLFFNSNKTITDDHGLMQDWSNIYTLLTNLDYSIKPKVSKNKILCFVADGGFSNWTGRDILTKGVGGSETHVIEMARYIKKHSDYDVYVFCKCDDTDIFEGVSYIPLHSLTRFVMENYVTHCIVSRFSEYLPMIYEANTENVYLFLHDIRPSGNILVDHTKLKNIFCLTEWHKNDMCKMFPTFAHKITYYGYGIDIDKFCIDRKINDNKLRFIYSSFPNRGLFELLQMWSKIITKIPNAELHIYCDIDGEWVNRVCPDYMVKVKALMKETKQIVYHGWVNKQQLVEGWTNADIWLYPCVFAETFCLTALEASLSKTLCITNGLAGLENTVGDRGICVDGDPTTEEWQDRTIDELIKIVNDIPRRDMLIKRNYERALTLSWDNRAVEFINTYLNVKQLEHKNNYNWSDNNHELEIFRNILQPYNELKRCNILEIGTYAGSSVINLLNHIKNSIATVVDDWKNYQDNGKTRYIEELAVEESFYKNINSAGLMSRISVYKGNTINKILQLYKENKKFDIIHVDAGRLEKEHEMYMVLTMSWKLMNKNGMLILENLKEPVNYFTEVHQIVHNDRCAFLRKLA